MNVLSKDYTEDGMTPEEVLAMQKSLVDQTLQMPKGHYLFGVGNIVLQAVDATDENNEVSVYYILMETVSLEEVQNPTKMTSEIAAEKMLNGDMTVLAFYDEVMRNNVINAMKLK